MFQFEFWSPYGKNKNVKRRRPNFGIAPLFQIILAPPLTHHWPPSRPNTWCWVNGANPWIASGEVWWVICRNCDFDSSCLNCCYILETNNPSMTGIPLYVIGGLYAQYWLNHSTLLIFVDCILIFVHKTNNPCRLNSLSLLKHPLLCLNRCFCCSWNHSFAGWILKYHLVI